MSAARLADGAAVNGPMRAVLAALLPPETAGYRAALEAKHFRPATAVGSVFTAVSSLTSLLELAAAARGSWTALALTNDREALLEVGVEAEALLPACRYLVVRTPGLIGLVDARQIPSGAVVEVRRTKPGAPCSLLVRGFARTPSALGVIIIGPNEAPNASTRECVWSAHPGLPVRPATTDRFAAGSTFSVGEFLARQDDRDRPAWLQIAD